MHDGVVVSDFEEQQALNYESEAILKTRSNIASLQYYLMFNKIKFSDEAHASTAWLFEQDDWLSTIASMQTMDNNILPGIFWFLAITHHPHRLNENLPVNFINQQLERALDELKHGKTIDLPWLLKQQETYRNEVLYHALPASEQETLWFDKLLAHVDAQDKDAWFKLLNDPNFFNKLDDKKQTKILVLLNQNRHVALSRTNSPMFFKPEAKRPATSLNTPANPSTHACI